MASVAASVAVFAATYIATLVTELNRCGSSVEGAVKELRHSMQLLRGQDLIAQARLEEIVAAGVAEFGRVITAFSAELDERKQADAALRISLQALAAKLDMKFAEVDGAKDLLEQLISPLACSESSSAVGADARRWTWTQSQRPTWPGGPVPWGSSWALGCTSDGFSCVREAVAGDRRGG